MFNEFGFTFRGVPGSLRRRPHSRNIYACAPLTLSTTQRYLHPSEDALQEAVEAAFSED